MGKKIYDAVYDAQLDFLKANSKKLVVCSAEPTTYEEANTTYALAAADITATNFTGPVAGPVSGRMLTLNPLENITISVSGTATHIALLDSTNSRLLLVTVCTAQALVAANKVTVDSFNYTLPQPAA